MCIERNLEFLFLEYVGVRFEVVNSSPSAGFDVNVAPSVYENLVIRHVKLAHEDVGFVLCQPVIECGVLARHLFLVVSEGIGVSGGKGFQHRVTLVALACRPFANFLGFALEVLDLLAPVELGPVDLALLELGELAFVSLNGFLYFPLHKARGRAH